MMSADLRHRITSRVHHLIQAAGWDAVRASVSEPQRALPALLKRCSASVVLDVGANDGGYAGALRRHGFSGRMVSFEPLEAAYQRLVERSTQDPLWDCRRLALGPTTGTTTINIAGNDGHSSSALPMLSRHEQSAPESRYVGVEEVPQDTLDNVLATLGVPVSQVYVKLDVQGYEAHVLAGAEAALHELAGIQLEVSLQPLYEGAPHYLDLIASLEARGFRTVQIFRGFGDRVELLQADFVLVR